MTTWEVSKLNDEEPTIILDDVQFGDHGVSGKCRHDPSRVHFYPWAHVVEMVEVIEEPAPKVLQAVKRKGKQHE